MKFLKNLLKDFKLIAGNEGGWAWAIPAAMAVYGAVQGEEQADQARRMNKAAATQTEFSPWTKMGAGQLRSEGAGALGGAVQGGLSGLSMMQAYDAANAAKGAAGATRQGQMQQMYDQQNMQQLVDQQKGQGSLYSGTYGMNQQPRPQGTWSQMYA